MDQNITYIFREGTPQTIETSAASSGVAGAPMIDVAQVNVSEGFVDPNASTARRIVEAYGDSLRRLADT